jgi:GntR family transcriptional regulator
MKFAINPLSEVPIHLQLREQIIFRISTGELPIGHVMPSVRELARHLGISHNTVSHVYAELVHERWLVQRRGSRLAVVERGKDADAAEVKDLEDLINRTIRLASERGYSLQQLAARIRERLLEQPPDHLLIVEPEREMGELMREEIRQSIGYAPAAWPISTLQHDPSWAIGAVLLTPAYLEEGLEGIPSQDRHIVSLTYAPADPHLARVRHLSEPSAVGVVSISPAALKTVSGLLASAVGERHTLHEFLMKWPVGKGGPRFTRFTMEEYPQRPTVRDFEPTSQKLRHEISVAASMNVGVPGGIEGAGETRLLSSDDLKFIDLLLCDTIAFGAVKHRHSVKCQLLSDESLREVAALAGNLPGFETAASAG